MNDVITFENLHEYFENEDWTVQDALVVSQHLKVGPLQFMPRFGFWLPSLTDQYGVSYGITRNTNQLVVFRGRETNLIDETTRMHYLQGICVVDAEHMRYCGITNNGLGWSDRLINILDKKMTDIMSYRV